MPSLFLGVTTSPAREFIASCILERKPVRALMPCAGRFATVEALVGSGLDRGKVIASDIGLFSSIVGYLADPRRSIDELAIRFTKQLPAQPVTGMGPEIDLGAQVMAALALGQISPKHQKGLNERAELLREWPRYHKDLATKLKDLTDNLKGVLYEVQDVWSVVDEATAADVIYVNVPTYKGGYDKMFGGGGVEWNAPTTAQFDYSQFPKLLDRIQASGASALVYSQRKVEALPAGWHIVFGQTLTAQRSDYIIASWDAKHRLAVQKLKKEDIQKFPVYADEELSEASQISMVRVNESTCLYYRDLFVHKLGSTNAEVYFLLLLDGRVITAFGIHWDFLRRFQSEYLYEDFGISRSSKRYKRLGKLFMMALTSGQTRDYLSTQLNFGVHVPRGIQTTCLATHREAKTDRSVLRRVQVDELPDKRFRIVYRGDFRPDRWRDVMANWFTKFGGLKR